MQLAILDIEIFSGLVVLLGAIFVALICDFLKGNNEQLRERNVELRTRQEERERLGIFQNPMQWIQALADALKPQIAEAAQESATAAAMHREAEAFGPLPNTPEADNGAAAESEGSQMRRRYYDEVKSRTQQSSPSWASKQELEQLAERAARIRARHETHKTHDDRLKLETETQIETERTRETAAVPPLPPPVPVAEPVVTASKPAYEPERPRPVVKLVGSSAMMPVYTPEPAPVPESILSFDQNKPGFRSSVSLPAYVPEVTIPAAPPSESATAPEPPSKDESNAEIVSMKVLPIDRSAPERYDGPVETEALDLEAEIQRVADLAIAVAQETAEQEAAREESSEQAPAPEVQPEEETVPVAVAETGLFLEHDEIEEPEPEPELVSLEPEMETSAPSEPVETPAIPALAAAIQEAAAREREEIREIPAGLHEAATLQSLVESGMMFSGVAVAIGINDFNGLKEKLAANAGLDSLGALNRMVQSMLRPQDFACQFTDDEFVLLYPGESGPSAQRRLFQVSEKLWDFQLRSLGHLSVMFSWGGLEVQNERLTEAVAAARERMYQTRRNRKANPLEGSSAGRRRVANG